MALAAMYILTVVGFPLASTLPAMLRLDSQIATIPFRVLVVVLAIGVIYGWWLRGAQLLFDAAVLVTLALWTLLILRMFHDMVVDPLPGRPYMPEPQLLLLSLGGCFLPALTALEFPSERSLDAARRGIEVLGAVAMLAILYVGLRGVFQGSVLYRLATPVLNPISVGHVGVSVLIVSLCGYATSGRIARLLRALLVILSVVVIVASVSRGPILAALVCVALLAMRSRGREGVGLGVVAVRVVLIAGAIAAIVLAVNHLEEIGIIDIVSRLTDTLQDVASQERTAMITGAWQQFTERPLTGSAFVELRFMENPHNIVLESLMALGVAGLGLLLISMGASLVAAAQVLRATSRHAWVALLYLQYLVNAMLSGSLFTDSAFWFYGLGVMALARVLRDSPGKLARDGGR
jgi:O-Antigen ligase